MPPTIFAIFVSCSLDLLFCINLDKLTKSFEQDRNGCQEYVKMIESQESEKTIIMGKCIWRINLTGETQ